MRSPASHARLEPKKKKKNTHHFYDTATRKGEAHLPSQVTINLTLSLSTAYRLVLLASFWFQFPVSSKTKFHVILNKKRIKKRSKSHSLCFTSSSFSPSSQLKFAWNSEFHWIWSELTSTKLGDSQSTYPHFQGSSHNSPSESFINNFFFWEMVEDLKWKVIYKWSSER